MKFLCIECDEAMKLTETRGPDSGSMTVVFGCPACGKRMAMLTNPMETQMVRALDVQIGGRSVPAEPMESLRSGLAYRQENAVHPESATASPAHAVAPASAEEKSEGSKCPFSGMVSDAFEEQGSGIAWTGDAEQRLEKIPVFVRPMVRKSIEQQAKAEGIQQIDLAFMDRMKGSMGM